MFAIEIDLLPAFTIATFRSGRSSAVTGESINRSLLNKLIAGTADEYLEEYSRVTNFLTSHTKPLDGPAA